jgi:hypothetical protein
VNLGVEGKFWCREVFSPVFLTFVSSVTKILLYFLVLALDFAIFFRVIDSSEPSFNSKTFVESMYKLGSKLWPAIREDFF